MPCASPSASTSATLRSSVQRRAACTSRASTSRTSKSGIAPGVVRTVMWMRARMDSDRLTLNSEPVPLNACIRIACHFWRISVE